MMGNNDKKLEGDDAPDDAPPAADDDDGLAEEIEAEGLIEAEDDIDIELDEDEEEKGEGEEFEDDAPRLQAEVDALNDRLLRAVAETENLRRRAAREREDAGKYAISGFARDLLAVTDNLRRALESLTDDHRGDESLGGLIAGVELTERELLAAFERNGIRRIDPMGEKFDPNAHQAIFQVEASDQPAGTVVEVVQAGYLIADRVLRPAMVGVAKAANSANGEPKDDAEGRLDTEA